MVHLKEIEKRGNHIICTMYVEDCTEGIFVSLDIKTRQFEEITLPSEYEWCKKYVHYAKNFLVSLIEENNIPESQTIMWY